MLGRLSKFETCGLDEMVLTHCMSGVCVYKHYADDGLEKKLHRGGVLSADGR
jgi:hypothetical protein